MPTYKPTITTYYKRYAIQKISQNHFDIWGPKYGTTRKYLGYTVSPARAKKHIDDWVARGVIGEPYKISY